MIESHVELAWWKVWVMEYETVWLMHLCLADLLARIVCNSFSFCVVWLEDSIEILSRFFLGRKREREREIERRILLGGRGNRRDSSETEGILHVRLTERQLGIRLVDGFPSDSSNWSGGWGGGRERGGRMLWDSPKWIHHRINANSNNDNDIYVILKKRLKRNMELIQSVNQPVNSELSSLLIYSP